jgi:hypothetical protein
MEIQDFSASRRNDNFTLSSGRDNAADEKYSRFAMNRLPACHSGESRNPGL